MISDNTEADLKRLAQNCFEASNGDAVKATEAMASAVRSADRLFRAVMDPMVSEACYKRLKPFFREQRKGAWAAAEDGRAHSAKARVEALAAGMMMLNKQNKT